MVTAAVPVTAALSPVPLVRAAYAESMLKTLDRIGISEAEYHRAGISRYAETTPYSLIPERPWWRLLDRVASREGIPDLGLLVGMDLPFPEVPSLAPGLTGCRTLLELLQSLCYQSSRQASHARFRLVTENEALWLRDEGPSLLDDPAEGLQIRLFRILGMIQVVQTVLGRQWRPRRILAACSYNQSIEAADALGAESMLFDQPYWAIELDQRSLNTFLHSSAVFQKRLAGAPLPPGAPDLPSAFVDSIEVLVAYYLSGGNVDVKCIARESDLSVRTLQRRLLEAGTSFSGLLLDIRLERASQLLKTTDNALSDIAQELGYSDYSKFSRTFKCRTGLTPNQFRQAFADPAMVAQSERGFSASMSR